MLGTGYYTDRCCRSAKTFSATDGMLLKRHIATDRKMSISCRGVVESYDGSGDVDRKQ
ncbi:hypothetical protein ACP4OV_024702 [Aristida adscensionis]